MNILVTTCLLMFCNPALAAQEAPPAQSRPNVVVFLADDLGWRDLGYSGSTFYETPNIDALAAKGMIFTSAYSACAVCSPTRAAVMTGRYPARVGITDYIGGPQPKVAATQPRYQNRAMLPAPYATQLALEETTVAEAFQAEGYATVFAGKWHLGRKNFTPDKQGFSVILRASSAAGAGAKGYFSSDPVRSDGSPGTAGEHLDLRLAGDMAKWIDVHGKQKPFFAYFGLFDVHTPLMGPPESVKYFEAKREKLKLTDEFAPDGQSQVRQNQSHATYAAMVKAMDDSIGTVVKQLESSGLLDNTIIVFTSDNGGLSTAEKQPTSNVPLRGGKGWAYEGGVRVPMFVIAPGITKPGAQSSARAISTDLFPTLLAACGLAARPKDHLDGISLLPALRGEPLQDRPLFWHYPHYGNQGGVPYSAVRSGDWKLIAFHDPAKGIELYNIADDPNEKTNRAKSEPARVKELSEMLAAWKQSIGAVDASPKPNP